MSTAEAEVAPGAVVAREQPETVEQLWRTRIQQSRNARRPLEPTWLSNLAFAAGKHWLMWHETSRQLRLPPELAGKELYTADVISEYRMTALGELGTEDDRPQLLLVGAGDHWQEEFQKGLNRAVAHGWEHEWYGDEVLAEIDRLTIDLGTAGARCRWDPDEGGPRRTKEGSAVQAPYRNGQPILDPEQARSYVADTAAGGGQADIRTLNEGRICWEPLSAFNILPPPGVPNERDFPWEIVVQPTLLQEVQDEFPQAATLTEDGDIGSVLGTDYQSGMTGFGTDAPQTGTIERLRGHIWLYTCYERPTRKIPNGRVVTLAGAQKKLLRIDNGLPYRGPDGDPRSGVHYFHWQRVTGRFFSRSLVEVLKDPQRRINRRITQSMEIIDRGMPFVLVQQGSIVNKRQGVPMEKVELEKGTAPPVINQGVGPGPWMQGDVEAAREDLEHASGFRGVRLGENPSGVSTYSQLALLNENDRVKRQTIGRDRALAIAGLVEDSIDDMRRYWGSSRQVLFQTSPDAQVEGQVFDATKIPPFYIVKVAKGATQPRGQAAQLKMVEDIFTAAINVQQPLPVSWLMQSYQLGQAQPLPDDPGNDQRDKAQLENQVMYQTKQPLHVAYYDPLSVHLGEHRSAQIQAEIAGLMDVWEALEAHIQEHLRAQAQNAQQVAESGATGDMPVPGQPGQPAQPGQQAAGNGRIPYPVQQLGGPGLDIRPPFRTG